MVCLSLLHHKIMSVIHFARARYLLLIPAVLLAACSSAPGPKQAKAALPEPAGVASSSSKHPLVKYIELSGFRIREAGAGKLQVKFIAVNHSEADMGELSIKVRMTTTAAKPEDPPVAEFEAKVPALGPQEIREVRADAPTKLRAYEIPDWQFIKTDFDITSPAP
jgi:hypothetical protein